MKIAGLMSLLGIAVLLLSAYPSVLTLVRGVAAPKVVDSVMGGEKLPLILYMQLGGFVAAALFVHVALGLLAAGLAWACERGGLSLPQQRHKIAFLWFFALTASMTLWAAAAFPRSHAADYYGAIATAGTASAPLHVLVTVAVVALAGFVLAKAAFGLLAQARPQSARAWSLVLLGGIGAAVALPVMVTPDASAAADQQQPHVIVIGVDSLRLEALSDPELAAISPNLRKLVDGARVYEDSVTPFARTFPAWLSILTGRSPERNGVVCNLTPRDQLDTGPTLADTLATRGYRTYFATDEVRFSNIDETYGFDRVITPTIGAVDFLIGEISDLPLVNLVAETAAGAVLFPALHSNRAIADTYRPQVFVPRVKSAVEFEAPTFLAVHFTAPHWPYHFADAAEHGHGFDDWENNYIAYKSAVGVADRQVGELMEWLEQSGALDNAILVLLSDHGEALGRPGDSLLSKVDDQQVRQLTVATFGHGSSVLSPTQYQVLLAFRGFGAARGLVAPGRSDAPASLEDVTPTLLAMLGENSLVPMDGQPLGVGGESIALTPEAAGERIRFTETGYNSPRMLAGQINPQWLALESAHHYSVNDANAYVELKTEAQQRIEEFKERAAIKGDWVLAALPTVDGEQLFVFARRDGSWARVVSDPADHPELPGLWSALRDRYGEAIQPIQPVTIAPGAVTAQAR